MNNIPLKEIPEEQILQLIEKLDVRGQRYTSYPTVPIRKSGQFSEDFTSAIKRISSQPNPIAIYLHLPYCNSRCFYCGCNSCITREPEKFTSYIDSLKREIDMVASFFQNGLSHCQLHLGGGTPTHFPPEMLADLLDFLIKRIPGTSDVDRSIEVDPRVTTEEHLSLLSERGFNRISMGLQDLDPAVQKAVNRIYPADKMKMFVESAREHGFGGVNIDLIYGLPKQTRETWIQTMQGVLEFAPDRLACFGFAYLPSKIKHQRAINESDLPSPEARLGMLLDANRFFADNGYKAIGMDHFAKPDDELTIAMSNGKLWRNFMGYTANAGLELLGFGCSSISEFKDLFVQNLFPPEPYQEKLSYNILPIIKGYKLDRDDIIRKHFINHLMCNLEVRVPPHNEKDDSSTIEIIRSKIDELKPYEKKGLLIQDDKGYQITHLGQLFLRNLAMPFDRYLSKDSKTKFSRTV